jgi:hypothetical protein
MTPSFFDYQDDPYGHHSENIQPNRSPDLAQVTRHFLTLLSNKKGESIFGCQRAEDSFYRSLPPQPNNILFRNPPDSTHLIGWNLLSPKPPVDRLRIDPKMFCKVINSEKIAHGLPPPLLPVIVDLAFQLRMQYFK